MSNALFGCLASLHFSAFALLKCMPAEMLRGLRKTKKKKPSEMWFWVLKGNDYRGQHVRYMFFLYHCVYTQLCKQVCFMCNTIIFLLLFRVSAVCPSQSQLCYHLTSE